MRNVRNSKAKRSTRSLFARHSVAVAAIDVLEKRQMLSTTLASWTFSAHNFSANNLTASNSSPATTPAGLSPTLAADSGTGNFVGYHASTSNLSVYTSPFGNGQSYSVNSTNWQYGDYYQFNTSISSTTTGVTLSFDQTSTSDAGTSDAPTAFQLQYSTGTTYTNIGLTPSSTSPYTVLVNGASPNTPWTSIGGNQQSNYTLTPILPSTTTGNFTNVAGSALGGFTGTLSFRMVDVSSTTGGSDRIDNVIIAGTTAPTYVSNSVNATLIADTTASLNANISAGSIPTITAEGFVIAPSSTDPSPTIGDGIATQITNANNTLGGYQLSAGNLTNNTNYNFAAYTITPYGTLYSSYATFKTLPASPTQPTLFTPTAVAGTTANSSSGISYGITFSGNISSGTSPVLSSGIAYSLASSNPTPVLNGAGVTVVSTSSVDTNGPFTVQVPTIPGAGVYNFSTYVTTSQGTYNSAIGTITFSDPSFNTSSSHPITIHNAELGGVNTGVTITNSNNTMVITHILSSPGTVGSQNYFGYNFLLEDQSGIGATAGVGGTNGKDASIEVTGYIPAVGGGYIPKVGDTISSISGTYALSNSFPVLQNVTGLTNASTGAAIPALQTVSSLSSLASLSSSSYNISNAYFGFMVDVTNVALGGNTQSSPSYLNSYGSFGAVTAIPETISDISGNSINFNYTPANNYYTARNLQNQTAYPNGTYYGVDITGILDYSGKMEIQPISSSASTGTQYSPIVQDNTNPMDYFNTSSTVADVSSGNSTVTITVTRNSLNDTTPELLAWNTSNGTGVIGVDFGTADSSVQYTNVNSVQTLNFSAGVTSLTFSIPVLQRLSPSGLHTFRVNFSRPSQETGLFSAPSYTVTVNDSRALFVNAYQFDNLPYKTVNATVGNPAESNYSPLIVTAVLAQPGTTDGRSYTSWAVLVQDSSGGPANGGGTVTNASFELFGVLPNGFTPVPGEAIQVTGTVSPFSWIPEMGNITAISVVSYGNPVPTPQVFNTSAGFQTVVNGASTPTTYPQGNLSLLAHLVEIDNVYISGATGSFATQNIQGVVSTGPNGTGIPLELYYWPSSYSSALSYFYGQSIPSPTAPVNLIGFISNYSNAGTGGNEFVPIEYAGNNVPDEFSYNPGNANAPFPTDVDLYPNFNRGTSVTVQITRTTSTDLATIPFSLLPDSAQAGLDYLGVTNVSGGTVANTSGGILNPSGTNPILSGILTFQPGVYSINLTIQATPEASDPIPGNKLFTVELGTSAELPTGAVDSNGHTIYYGPVEYNTSGGVDGTIIPSVFLTGPTTLEIVDTTAGTTDTEANASFAENYTINENGVYSSTPTDYGTTRVEVGGTLGNGGDRSYSLLTYNDPSDAAHYFSEPYPNNTVLPTMQTIDGVELETYVTALSGDHDGYINVYLVSNDESSLTRGSSRPYFNGSYGSNSNGLLPSQVGTSWLLGTFLYNHLQPANQYTPFNLTNLNPAALALLSSDVANGSKFSIALTPGTVLAPESGQVVGQIDTGVSATFVGSTLTNFEAPILRFDYSSSLPGTYSWLSNGSNNVIYSYPTNTLIVNGSATLLTNPPSGSPTLAVVNGGTLTIVPSNPTLNGLSLANSSSAAFNSGSGNLMLLGAGGLTIDSTSRLDIGDNFINIQNGSGSLSTVQSEIQSGSLYSSDKSLGLLGTIGVIVNSQLGTSTPIRSTFGGTPAGPSDLLIRYTYFGDANLDGTVNSADYGFIDNSWLSEQSSHANVSGWGNGDFNYDGIVNGSDYTLIDNAFNTQGSALATATAEIANPGATPAALIASPNSTDSFFSDKKVKPSLISGLEDLITAG